MACSFRGAGSPSSLEIQWWYIKDHQDWQQKPPQITNNVSRQGKQLGVEQAARVREKLRGIKGENIKPALTLQCTRSSFSASSFFTFIDEFHHELLCLQIPFSVVPFQFLASNDLFGVTWTEPEAF